MLKMCNDCRSSKLLSFALWRWQKGEWAIASESYHCCNKDPLPSAQGVLPLRRGRTHWPCTSRQLRQVSNQERNCTRCTLSGNFFQTQKGSFGSAGIWGGNSGWHANGQSGGDLGDSHGGSFALFYASWWWTRSQAKPPRCECWTRSICESLNLPENNVLFQLPSSICGYGQDLELEY